MRILSRAAIALATLGFLGLAPNGAKADVVLTADLTQDNCTGGCTNGVTPCGTVTITQAAAGADLVFSVQLNGPYFFQVSTGMQAFVFNSLGTLGIVAPITAGFTPGGAQHEDGFGDFT